MTAEELDARRLKDAQDADRPAFWLGLAAWGCVVGAFWFLVGFAVGAVWW